MYVFLHSGISFFCSLAVNFDFNAYTSSSFSTSIPLFLIDHGPNANFKPHKHLKSDILVYYFHIVLGVIHFV